MRLIYSERNGGTTIVKRSAYIWALKRCDTITCNAKVAKEIMEAKLERDVIFIKNGIDIPQRIVSIIDKPIRNILLPARIHPEKNQLYAIDELATNKNAKLFLAGKIHDQEYYELILQRIQEYNAEDRVKYLGYNERISDEYNIYDLIILPSKVEGTPNTILEAFAFGVPAIASNIPMNSILFDDKKLLFDLDEPNGLKKCIAYLNSMDFEKKRRMVYRNREVVVSQYSTEKMVAQYIDIFKSNSY